jgi:hypothetical protein
MVPATVSYACCGVVRNGCRDVSALRGATFKFSAAPLPPKPAIACTSCEVEPSKLPMDVVGGETTELPIQADRTQRRSSSQLMLSLLFGGLRGGFRRGP